MSTNPEDLEEDHEDEQPRMVQMERKHIRALERKANAADQARSEAQAALRELAFLKAGIPDTGPGKLFSKAYDGELTAEAIRQAALDYEIIIEEASVPEDELATHTRMTNTASGASPSSGKVDINDMLKAAKSPEEVREIIRRFDLKMPVQMG
jgi:hypothetical protein